MVLENEKFKSFITYYLPPTECKFHNKRVYSNNYLPCIPIAPKKGSNDLTMKKFKKTLVVIAVIIGVPLLVVAINNLAGLYYNTKYTAADKGTSSESYTFKKLPISGTIEYHFDNETAYSTNIHDTIPKEGNDGHLYYDAAQQKIIVQTENYVPSPNNPMDNIVRQYHTIDKNGNVAKTDSLPENIKSVKNQLVPFQKWQDDSQVIYMRHFTKQDFDMPSLNPLRGMGNPTGGRPARYWEGPAYYDVKFKGEVLKVKIPCESGAFLFTADHEYATGLHYYLLPELDIAFLVYSKFNEPNAIYMIKHK